MQTNSITSRARRWRLAAIVLLATGALSFPWLQAQERRERPQEPDGAPRERDGEREGGFGSRRAPQGGEREGSPEGMPQTRLAPQDDARRPYLLPNRWLLGVYAYNTPTGVVVTRVQPHSPAATVGLEPNDLIVTVDGFQVGNVGGQLYLLGDELQHRGEPDGRVKLLVQNCRNNQLMNIDVPLQRDPDIYDSRPRER